MKTSVLEREQANKPKVITCAIYTRKSTDENLDTDFNSLDSQREYCQSFIKSREGEGWRIHPEPYNDPAFSGGNINRPALRQLLADAAKGQFQVVVCYKYDRLSRNTKDFLHILEIFDRHGIAFVSVTQPIDTTSSVGRLMRSILMDFSQFEREMISERTRDKLHAMALKGKRLGSWPILGYDIDPETRKLHINAQEAEQVLEIFRVYRKTKSLGMTCKLLSEKGILMKAWKTKGGSAKGGQKFNKANLWNLLRSPLYLGKILHRNEALPGEHQAIVPEPIHEEVNKLMRINGDGKVHRVVEDKKHNFLLRGLLRCLCCETAMTPHHVTRKGHDGVYSRFFYYRCVSDLKNGKSGCHVRNVSAKAIEMYVINRLKTLADNQDIVDRIVKKAQAATSQELPIKLEEKKRMASQLGKIESEINNLVAVLGQEGPQSPTRKFVGNRLSELEPQHRELEGQIERLNLDIQKLETQRIDADVARRIIKNFLLLFDGVTSDEQVELIQLLVQKVLYDEQKSTVQIALRPLPEAWGDLEVLKGSIVYRQRNLPD